MTQIPMSSPNSPQSSGDDTITPSREESLQKNNFFKEFLDIETIYFQKNISKPIITLKK